MSRLVAGAALATARSKGWEVALISTRRGWLKLGMFVVGVIAVVAATAALAASRDQRWEGVASGFNSQTWYAFSKGGHTMHRYTCSSNYPNDPATTFTLYHQRGGLPDENKGVMIRSAPCNGTNYSGTASSDDTENHYWKLTYPVCSGCSALRESGTGRIYYPG
jgi:hypothetical protein